MSKTVEDNEKVLVNLRASVEDDANKISELTKRVKRLEAKAKKKDETIGHLCDEASKIEKVITVMVSRSELIYKEYKAALAAFGAEPFPLPTQTEGEQGVVALLDWLLREFEGLREILVTASDNAATLSCESVLAILDREVARIL
jgi:polyhydroxyalkanoate synthesis regulator phasin